MKADAARKPFLLRPAGKDYIWGGHRLIEEYAKDLPMDPLAETRECSTHVNGISQVGSGAFEGMSLRQVLTEHPDYISIPAVIKDGDLPILVKLIDARRWLSVQVHPDDDFAQKVEGQRRGKTEMWYIMDSKPGSSMVVGFSEPVSEDGLRGTIMSGRIGRSLNYIRPEKDEIYLIEPGTVHAIGPGLLIAEVQESSDLTYRLYDYDRTDKNGKKRELHIDKALQVMNREVSGPPKNRVRVRKYHTGYDCEFLCRCRYFEVERISINTSRCHDLPQIMPDPNTFSVLLCLDGCGALYMEDGDNLKVFKGDCIFIPAACAPLRFHGVMTCLKITS